MRSKILSIGLALIPAAVLVSAQSSLGEAKGDDCRAKPEGTSPAGLHWYYRVDRANNRHCWYLHEQGMRVHSLINTGSRSSDVQNGAAGEQVWKTPPVTGVPQPEYKQSDTTREQPAANFSARWVDLPRSVDLNAHGSVAQSTGYAAEHAGENNKEQLPPTLADVSAANGDVQQNTGSQTNFGSISLAGAVVLGLLLMSEALVRLARRFAWSLLRFSVRADSRRRAAHSDLAVDAAPPISPIATEVESLSRTQAGVNELQRLLQRVDAGLRPPQSFAPSRSVHRHEHADRARARAHSAFTRLKSRSFSGMTWAPL